MIRKWLKEAEKYSTDAKLTPVEAGEKVLGVVPEDLRGVRALLYSVYEELAAEAKRRLEAGAKEAPDDLMQKAHEAKLLDQIFWAELRGHFPAKNKGIGVREGWQVVELPPDPLESIFGVLLGRGDGEGEKCGNPDCEVHGHLNRTPEPAQTN